MGCFSPKNTKRSDAHANLLLTFDQDKGIIMVAELYKEKDSRVLGVDH